MTQYAKLRIDAPVRLQGIAAAVQALADRGVPEHARVQISEEPPMPGLTVRAYW